MDVEEMERNPNIFTMRMSRWIWSHNPVQYARENYAKAMAAVINGTAFENTNLPPGFVYKPWTIEDELSREKKGLKTELYDTGDWS